MAQYLFIVSGRHPDLYEYLHERFSGDPQARVILDRRLGDRRGRSDPVEREHRVADRRAHPDIDTDLQSRSHAIVTLGE